MDFITIVPAIFGVVTLAYAQNNTAHIIAHGKHIQRKIYRRNGGHYIRYNNELVKIIYS